jgi:hypothetical protein
MQLQIKTEDQRRKLALALQDMLTLTPEALRLQRYTLTINWNQTNDP